MFMSNSIYDANPHMFSPSGTLLQIEYAYSAANKGSTAIGIRTENAVVLVTEKSRHSSLLVSKSLNKINLIDDHALCVYSGIVSDANILVDRARTEAENHRFTYDEPMSIRSLVQSVGSLANTYQDPDISEEERYYARPFGVSMIYAGFDTPRDDETVEEVQESQKRGISSMRLYLLTPASTEESWKSIAIGYGGQCAMKELEKLYKSGLTADEAMVLALKVLKNVSAHMIEPENVEVALIDRLRGAVVCSDVEIQAYLVKAVNATSAANAANASA